MSSVKQLMTSEVVSVNPDDSIEEAISRMLKHGLSSLPVLDASGHPLGIVSEFDLLELVWNPKTDQDKVYHYMTREVHTVDEGTDLGSVAETFRVLSIRRMPVVRQGRMVGIIAREDLLRHVMRVRGQIPPVVPRPLSPAGPLAPHPVSL